MALKAEWKTTFEAGRVIAPIYTGGSVALSENGRILATCLGDEALLTDLDTGARLARLEGDGEPITTLALSPDAQYLVLCSRSISMRIYALQPDQDGTITATLVRTLKPHATPVVTAAIDSTSSLLATGGADGVVKVWDLRGGYTTHTFHGHSGVISALHVFRVDARAEEVPKVRKRKSREANGGPEERQDDATAGFRLASGGEDGRVRVWDLQKRTSVASLEAHASVVRSLHYSGDAKALLSASRDKTAMIWDARTWQARSTVPVLEGVESAGFIFDGNIFYTGGENGRLRTWASESGQELTEEQQPGIETEAIVDALHFAGLPFVLSVHADQTLLLHSLKTLKLASDDRIPPLPVLRRISGTHDEVIDLAYVGRERRILALATNLEDIRLISIDDSPSSSTPFFGADLAVLKGHSDIIITLDIDWSGHWLATGAKDNTAKLWRLDPDTDSYTCYTTFTGHAESISAVALPKVAPAIGSKEYNSPLQYPPKHLVTASQDKTIKRWDVPAASSKPPKAAYTRKAHDKDINAVSFSHSAISALFASASQDRTAKIWDVETGEAVGVLRGHKRGVWSAVFAPQDMPSLTTSDGGGASSARGMVLTGSGDKTVRIWNLTDYSCLRTFEGHANSVLKVVWLPAPEDQKGRNSRGVQVASAAGDGLVKVWNAQEGECAATLDNHIDRVWALAVKPAPLPTANEQARHQSADSKLPDAEDEDTDASSPTLEIVSGSADSTLTFWSDTTASTALAATTQTTARIEQDQELQNHIRTNNFREAIVLALQLNHPKRLLDLLTAVVSGPREAESFSGRTDVDNVLKNLSDTHLFALMRRLRDWNANARTHHVAQHILHTLLRLHPKEKILGLNKRRRAPQHAVDGELADAMSALSTTAEQKAQRKESVRDVLDGLKAYTERHHARLERQAEERFVLVWALEQMGGLGDGTADVADGLGGVKGVNGVNGMKNVNGTRREGDDVMMLDGA